MGVERTLQPEGRGSSRRAALPFTLRLPPSWCPQAALRLAQAASARCVRREVPRVCVIAALVTSLTALAGCSHPSPQRENRALFLTLNRVRLAGDLAGRSDAELLTLGHRACADLDHGQSSDQVVADLSDQAEPGSAGFNAAAYVAATAAKELCPQHASAFSGAGALINGDDGP